MQEAEKFDNSSERAEKRERKKKALIPEGYLDGFTTVEAKKSELLRLEQAKQHMVDEIQRVKDDVIKPYKDEIKVFDAMISVLVTSIDE